jgi:predicted DNA-binding transcriptional regulator YafY
MANSGHPPASRRAVRLVKIPLLLVRQSMRAAELAAHFGVSQRTINRDIELLRGPVFGLRIELNGHWEWELLDTTEEVTDETTRSEAGRTQADDGMV